MRSGLPELLDCKALRAELGVTRAAAEAIMRHIPVVVIEDLRKTYVRRDDVLPLPGIKDVRETGRTIVTRGGRRLDPLDKAPPCSPRCILLASRGSNEEEQWPLW